MKDNDKYYYIKWEDSKNIQHIVGILARIEGKYYCLSHEIKQNRRQRSAYDVGFNGIPSFQPGRLYVSRTELFDFFRNRVINNENKDVFEELQQTKGELTTDSFSVEPIPKQKELGYKTIIIQMENKIKGNIPSNRR